MLNKTDAIFSLLKSLEPTLKCGGFRVIVPSDTQKGELPFMKVDDKETLGLSGEIGSVLLIMSDKKLQVLCSDEVGKSVGEMNYKAVSLSMFDYDEKDFDARDIKSLANEISDSIIKFYHIDMSSGENSDAVAEKAKIDAAKRKKVNKNSSMSYESINLAAKISNIYPEIKDKIDENVDTYNIFLGDIFFDEVANPLIIDSIKKQDRQTMKKLFNVFNTFYDEGPKDTQSLVAVTILGRNIEKEPEILDIAEEYMDENLGPAVKQIAKYLSKATTKGTLKKFDNPVATKPKKVKKVKAIKPAK